jgi:DNA-binding NarL/FixJ family response regulator
MAVQIAVAPRERPTVGLISRQRLLREALRTLLRTACRVEVTLVDDADVARLGAAGEERLGVVVLDASSLDGDTAVLLARLPRAGERPPVVLLVDHVEGEIVRTAMHAGVEGLLDCGATGDALVMTVRQVLDGQSVFPCSVPRAASEAGHDGLELLSDRQREVLGLLACGRSNDEIAGELFISVNTVKFHLREIFHKLGLHNRVQAAQSFTTMRARIA